MVANRWIPLLASIAFLVSLFFVNWQADRNEFGFIVSFYSLAFGAYILLIANRHKLSFYHFALIAILSQVLCLLYIPNLSNDFYRFLWDGEITLAGYNPFDFTPNEIYQEGFAKGSSYLEDMYTGIGSLSQRNYSCYPPVNQLYFIVSTAFSDSLMVNVIVLKLSIIATQILGAIYLRKLLIHLKIETSRMWFLYLNPLWIIECTGNVHFEGVMLSLLFVALYYLLQYQELVGSLFFALAIQIKLVPLILFPFFLRFLGIWKAMIFYSLTLVLVFLLGLIQLDAENIHHFFASLRLYFEVFEFNSFVLHYYVQYGIAETGWNLTKVYGPQLSKIALGLIVFISLLVKRHNWQTLFRRMVLAYFIYLLLSSTLHPWYILPMLALSIFTNYSFPILWSLLIFFSYILYAYMGHSDQIRWIIDLEYILVLSLFAYEMIWKRTPIGFLRLHTSSN